MGSLNFKQETPERVQWKDNDQFSRTYLMLDQHAVGHGILFLYPTATCSTLLSIIWYHASVLASQRI